MSICFLNLEKLQVAQNTIKKVAVDGKDITGQTHFRIL